MTIQSVTVKLPENIYRQIRRAARKARRPLDDVLAEAVSAAAPMMETSVAPLRFALAQMSYLNDAALWQAARASLSAKQRSRLALLHTEQQRRSLTPEERTEEEALMTLYRETILVRAQAAVLLKQRGYDVADAAQFEPLE
jgi:hypothetical protein